MKITAALVLLWALVSMATGGPVGDVETCGKNELYNACGSACPATCEPNPAIVTCPPVCVRGCFCQPGFVRDANYNCIEPADCPNV
ncbi:hypothetical protein RP20_CCG017356 [Aedes albopictus]|nr:chymotrypsin inhibitor-like [Aedes albopictus]KXJ81879.1 hypothetical protein RP20_CCG017356 [Aedes albopictus]